MFNFVLYIVRALGSQVEKAFKDPIQEIKKEYGLIEDEFIKKENEVVLSGPFSQVSVFMTDNEKGKWVDTGITG